MNRLLRGLLDWTERLQGPVALAAGLTTIAIPLLGLAAALDLSPMFRTVGQYLPFAFFVLTWMWIGLLTLSLWLLRSQFSTGFADNPRIALNRQWDNAPALRRSEADQLVVTGSDQGVLTKRGANWENYSFTFEAFILNGCLGVVVRASDPNNYYMIQIGRSRIRPHRRVAVPKIRRGQKSTGSDVVTYEVVWHPDEDLAVDLGRSLDDGSRGKSR